MKNKLHSFVVLPICLLMFAATSNCQNGPTKPVVHNVTLGIQNPASGGKFNCVYRGSAAGSYTIPALFCSTALITSYSDSSVVGGTTYHYAVTVSNGTAESAFSNDVTAPIPGDPVIPAAPSVTLTLVAGLNAPKLAPSPLPVNTPTPYPSASAKFESTTAMLTAVVK